MQAAVEQLLNQQELGAVETVVLGLVWDQMELQIQAAVVVVEPFLLHLRLFQTVGH
jgi:hypothetical protein